MISLTRLPTITTVEESWNQMKDTIHKAASATLGVTKPDKRYINRDTWLWNDDVEMKVREKKRLYYQFLDDKTLANWRIHKNANRGRQRKQLLSRKWTITKIFTINWTQRDLYGLAKSGEEHFAYQPSSRNG